jgi:hypothetical protein
MAIFERFNLLLTDGGAARPRPLPPRPYFALAIAGDSEIDICKVDGIIVGPGSPLLLDGTQRTLIVEPVRPIPDSLVRLVGVTHPAGLPALPQRRSVARVERVFTAHATTQQLTGWTVCGRRHTSIGISTSAGDITTTVYGERYYASGDILTKTFTARVTDVNREDFFEVGGTNEEECWDRFNIDFSPSVSTTTRVIVESYGELGR